MSYYKLLPLVKKTGSQLSPKEFQKRINIVFHDYEADHYDKLHCDMKESLQEQINLLVDDLFISKIETLNNLCLLDIGAGTGLSTQMLLNTKLGFQIENITLLDTSINMLKYAEEKAKKWQKKYSIINSDISSLSDSFDIIMICSVLHHIPELDKFLSQVDSLLKPGGILIHLQDPNGDYLEDKIYINRIEQYNKELNSLSKKKTIKQIIPKNWKHFINRLIGRKTYIDLVNNQLLKEKVIKRRMSADEIWSVTDIRVESKLNKEEIGISFKFLKQHFRNYKLISHRSYCFFGFLKSTLTVEYVQKENNLIKKKELNGRNISCIWVKK
ncbi:MAG: class I SAM-dependent methyltransferase [Flavobacteriaceae bacterium]|nr:class I SAM-dependent methyltransferase [Flavobacteriaceae bacterium]